MIDEWMAFYNAERPHSALAGRTPAEAYRGEEPVDMMDGHHIAIYVADFSGPYEWLIERGLVTVEDNDHQYRCQDLVPPHGGRAIWTMEHEIRSLHHPHWNRWLVNRAGPDRLGGLRLSP